MATLDRRDRKAFSAVAAICSTLIMSVQISHASEVLITDAEAKLPTQKGAVATSSRGITRGPRIELIDNAKDGSFHSPIHFQLKFQSFGGSKIDPSGLQVTYLKVPAVDLTGRVKPFVQEAGVDMPDALLPPGEHPLRIDIKDSEGRTATTSFVLKVSE